jgi:hypothetical protein
VTAYAKLSLEEQGKVIAAMFVCNMNKADGTPTP